MGTSGYILTPLADGGTHAIYQLKLDMKMVPPRLMVAAFNKKHGYRLLELEKAMDALSFKS